MRIKPLGERVLIEEADKIEGIILPPTEQEHSRGKVIATNTDLEVGKIVIFLKLNATKVFNNWYLVDVNDVIGEVEEVEE